MTTDSIRARLFNLGWSVKEIPVKRRDQKTQQIYIDRFKLIAIRGEKSLSIEGKTIDKAMQNLGEALGVIPREGN